MVARKDPSDHKVTVENARAMVRLVADTAMHGNTAVAKKRFLLTGLSRMVNTDAWGWALSCQMEPGAPQVYVSYVNYGLSDERFTRKMAAYSHPEMARIAQPIFDEVARTGRTVTMARHQIDPEDTASRGEIGELWKAADIGPILLSYTPLDEKSASGIALFRRIGEPDFTDREIAITHIVLTEVPWLHQMGWPEDMGATVPRLTPKQRIVLNLLLDGLPREAIAGQMEISRHTLDDYVKDVFRHFSVSSHAQLMRRFYQ